MLGIFKKFLGTGSESSRIETGFIARDGLDAPVAPTPAWALLLRSPYDESEAATSWLGGLPHAPRDLAWPADEDGRPLHFLAQIDLASLRPEPTTGARPPGLPQRGALLVFVGRSYACRVIGAEAMERATTRELPDGIGPIREHGFFGDVATFDRWPVDAVPFIDATGERPAFLPDPFAKPRDWIVNRSIAALEAAIVIEILERELEQGHRFLAWRRASYDGTGNKDVIEGKTAYYTGLAQDAPAVIMALKAWRESVRQGPGEAPVAINDFNAIFALRWSLHDRIELNYPPKGLLRGSARAFWERLRLDYPEMDLEKDFNVIPDDLRPFVTMWITDWRSHRLFGVEPPFGNNGEDTRGQDCLISIAADPLLNTCSEHEYGMSVWCPGPRLARGQYDKGQFVRHNAC